MFLQGRQKPQVDSSSKWAELATLTDLRGVEKQIGRQREKEREIYDTNLLIFNTKEGACCAMCDSVKCITASRRKK